MNKQQTKISKRLSLILRHDPDSVGLNLDESGWAEVKELITALNNKGIDLDEDRLKSIVFNNPKKRFEFDVSGQKIRARQGHSINVDLGYSPSQPPDKLYHGTPSKFLESIKNEGLKKQQRHHVHMSEDIPLMIEVARRRGIPRLLEINAKEMSADGYQFYRTDNDVWLCENIPSKYLKEVNPETIKI